ncbi:MAG: hypothetical protein ACRDK9_07820 [Solirubrobacterales bacterium]
MDLSRLSRYEVIGAVAAGIGLVALLFLPWYDLTDTPERAAQGAWLCGTEDFSCTGFETFPILRWLLIAAGFAPLILAYILVRGHKLSWPPGEMTMVVGFAATVLIGYNGIIDKPAPDEGQEFGISLAIGYWITLLVAIAIATTGFLRSMESGAKGPRKAPGTV